MNLKKIERFFGQMDAWRLIGGAMAVIGLILYMWGWSMVSYYASLAMMPIGVILFFVASARFVAESEIRQTLQKATVDVDADIVSDADLSHKLLKNAPTYRGESFAFATEEGVTMARHGKDAAILTNLYWVTTLYFTADALLLRARRVNLADGSHEDVSKRLPWEDLGSATVTSFEISVALTNRRNGRATARGAYLELNDKEGVLIYRAPVKNDMDADTLCEHINKYIAAASL